MTRRHHPLQGQELIVLRMAGQADLIVQLRDGSGMMIPREWTSADGEHGSKPAAVDRTITLAGLRELLALVDALKRQT